MHYCPSCHQPVEASEARCSVCGASPDGGWPADPLAGRVVGGKYRIERRIGADDTGIAFDAVGLESGRHVVLTTLHPDRASDPVLASAFVEEARAARAVRAEQLAEIIDVDVEDGTPYLVQEQVHGQTLAEILEAERRLDVQRAVRIGQQVALGLEKAHGNDVFHGCLRPDRIVIQKLGDVDHIKVVDLGYSCLVDASLLQDSGMLDALMYLPPEAAAGLKPDAQADIYALGLMMFEMIAGRAPSETSGRDADEPGAGSDSLADLVPGVPATLDRLVHKMIARIPDARPSRIGKVVMELDGVTMEMVRLSASDEPGPVPIKPVPARGPSPSRIIGGGDPGMKRSRIPTQIIGGMGGAPDPGNENPEVRPVTTSKPPVILGTKAATSVEHPTAFKPKKRHPFTGTISGGPVVNHMGGRPSRVIGAPAEPDEGGVPDLEAMTGREVETTLLGTPSPVGDLKRTKQRTLIGMGMGPSETEIETTLKGHPTPVEKEDGDPGDRPIIPMASEAGVSDAEQTTDFVPLAGPEPEEEAPPEPEAVAPLEIPGLEEAGDAEAVVADLLGAFGGDDAGAAAEPEAPPEPVLPAEPEAAAEPEPEAAAEPEPEAAAEPEPEAAAEPEPEAGEEPAEEPRKVERPRKSAFQKTSLSMKLQLGKKAEPKPSKDELKSLAEKLFTAKDEEPEEKPEPRTPFLKPAPEPAPARVEKPRPGPVPLRGGKPAPTPAAAAKPVVPPPVPAGRSEVSEEVSAADLFKGGPGLLDLPDEPSGPHEIRAEDLVSLTGSGEVDVPVTAAEPIPVKDLRKPAPAVERKKRKPVPVVYIAAGGAAFVLVAVLVAVIASISVLRSRAGQAGSEDMDKASAGVVAPEEPEVATDEKPVKEEPPVVEEPAPEEPPAVEEPEPEPEPEPAVEPEPEPEPVVEPEPAPEPEPAAKPVKKGKKGKKGKKPVTVSPPEPKPEKKPVKKPTKGGKEKVEDPNDESAWPMLFD